MLEAQEIRHNIYWIGTGSENNAPNLNTYLLKGENGYLLIDPGPAVNSYALIERLQEIDPNINIDYILLHNHSTCASSSLPVIMKQFRVKEVIVHERSLQAIHSYGVKLNLFIIDNEQTSFHKLSPWKLSFIETPYIPFLESYITYIQSEKLLFSSSLFGAIPRKWKQFADKIFYKESMKAYHEQFVANNDLLRPVIETIYKLNLEFIAPHIGSMINKDHERLLAVLKDLKCGIYHNPIKNDLTRKEGYITLCNTVLHKLEDKLNAVELRNVFSNTDIELNEKQLSIAGWDGSGEDLWEKFFTLIYTKKGGTWLSLTVDLVKDFIKRYHVVEPAVFNEREKEIIKIDNENIRLKQQNELLEQAKNSLIQCPITGLNNEGFFRTYLSTELENHISNNENLCLLHIEIDDLSEIRLRYGKQGGTIKNQILKALAYLLEQLKENKHQLLKWSEETLALILPQTNFLECISLAEKIRNDVSQSEVFPQKITVSIGATSLDQFPELSATYDELIRTTEIKTLLAKRQGKDRVCSELDEDVRSTKPVALIADNDVLNNELLIIHLTEMGFDTITSTNGHEAMLLIEQEKINVVISELMLPKYNGFAIRESMLLDSEKKKIPFILLSHQKNEETIIQAYDLKVNGFLQKPYKMSELKGLVKNLTNS